MTNNFPLKAINIITEPKSETKEVDYKTWYQDFKPGYKKFNDNLPAYWALVYSDRWDILSKLAGRKFFDTRNVLEIGSGMGRALSWFKEFGGECLGIEPSTYASQIARQKGLNILEGYFQDLQDTDIGKFDVIYIEQVLSHIPDYKATLQKAADLLLDDGLIMIEEPNDNNELQKILEVKYGTYWIAADHVNYFSHDSLATACSEVGLKEVKRMSTFPMEFFAFMDYPYIGNSEVGEMVHKKRFDLENKLPSEMRIKLSEKWAELGIGRDILQVYKKGVL